MRTKVDNSFFADKVALRIKHLPDKKVINVLDAFCGDRKIWIEIEKRLPDIVFNYTGIDHKDNPKKICLVGENEKFLLGMDLTKFDVIDLDDYSIPALQIEIITKRAKAGTVIFVTAIQIMRSLSYKLLNNLGYSKKMIRKCPALFHCNGKDKILQYLSTLGIYYGKCDHGCKYCYVNDTYMIGKDPENIDEFLKKLDRSAKKHSRGEQVLLSFTSDPYCNRDVKLGYTRKVLNVLLAHQVTTTVLTKGGIRALRDIDIFKQFDSFALGQTMTFVNDKKSKEIEPNASTPTERIDTLKALKSNGIKTWLSLEPVIDPEETLKVIEATAQFVDFYKVGKLNHIANNTDWAAFSIRAVALLRLMGKQFYIKTDLAKFYPYNLEPFETDPDFLTLKSCNTQETLF